MKQPFGFTKSDKIKMQILKILSDFKDHTPSEIALKLKTNGKTILSNCYFLKLMGFIEIDIKDTKTIRYYIRLKRNSEKDTIGNILKKVDNI